MWGDGRRRVCSECGQSVSGQFLLPQHRELRGPRDITSSNIDCALDDDGKRFLFIEYKRRDESMKYGQEKLLRGLAGLEAASVWVVRGVSAHLDAWEWGVDTERRFILNGSHKDLQKAVSRWFNRLAA